MKIGDIINFELEENPLGVRWSYCQEEGEIIDIGTIDITVDGITRSQPCYMVQIKNYPYLRGVTSVTNELGFQYLKAPIELIFEQP